MTRSLSPRRWPVFPFAALALLVACGPKTAHVQAKVEPPPALAVPPPPPRVIVPPQPEPPAQVEDAQPPSPARSRPQRAAPRPEAKPQTPPETQPAEPATTAPETASPAPEKPPTPADAAGVAAVRQQMGRATQNLTQVNYAGLSNDMRTQYDTANRFLALAEQALKEGNLLFASTLADKAGAIAALLTSR